MRSQRYSLALPIRYRVVGTGPWLTGRTENVSGAGVLFQAKEELTIDTPIEISIAIPPVPPASTPAEVRCQAHIVRIVASSSEQARPLMAAAFSDFEFTPTQLTSHA
jgi:PilZ domain-containing protein